jgi:hypothetical protein
VRLPSKRYLLQLFPPIRALLAIVAASVLTFATSFIPRPIYNAGLQTVQFGYPMPFESVTLEQPSKPITPVFVSILGARDAKIDWNLVLVNIGFYLTAFALARIFFRQPRAVNLEPE